MPILFAFSFAFLARLYESTGRAIALTSGVGGGVGVSKMFKFLHLSFSCDGQSSDR